MRFLQRSRRPGSANRWSSGGVLVLILSGILLVGGIGATGCVIVKAQVKPTPPVIEMVEQDGMVCMTKEDAIELGAYLIELEGRR